MASTPESMLRIISTGLQDQERLAPPAGQPTMNRYMSVIRQRTRWASQWRRVEFDTLADFGRKATVTLPVMGELISRAVLVVELPDLKTPQEKAAAAAAAAAPGSTIIGPTWGWTNSIGNALCANVEFTIGSQIVDRMDSRLLEVLTEQHTSVDHFDTENELLGRNPSDYTPTPTAAQTVQIVLPFWWNQGPGPQVLPIQALSKDKVQISVQFRPIQECVYTDSRVDSRNPGSEAVQAGPLPLIAGCDFYRTDPAGQPIYSIAADGTTPLGSVMPASYKMPTTWRFRDAYWIVEYISLENREAAAFRMADLQIPIVTHTAIPAVPTDGRSTIRLPIAQSGLVRDMTWIAQRTDAPSYNAWFLWSKDLQTPSSTPTSSVWWPDASGLNWNYGTGYIRPAFVDRRSDPISAASLHYYGKSRFEHEGSSLFRSLIPALNCLRSPIINRYIYRYDFGLFPTGGVGSALKQPRDQIRGFSNWDTIYKKELQLTMRTEDCPTTWEPYTYPTLAYSTDGPGEDVRLVYVNDVGGDGGLYMDTELATMEGFEIELRGAAVGGEGAVVTGVLSWKQIRSMPGFRRLVLRIVRNGSASVFVEKIDGSVQWLAVAGAGGSGMGGSAGSAVEIGTRGDGVQTHAADGLDNYGGAGGGILDTEDVGLPDGTRMGTTFVWAAAANRTGGTTNTESGGDGWTGGGSGALGGGGGGSYVGPELDAVYTMGGTMESTSVATITPVRRARKTSISYIIYIWLSSVNLLRVVGGRGALMFTA